MHYEIGDKVRYQTSFSGVWCTGTVIGRSMCEKYDECRLTDYGCATNGYRIKTEDEVTRVATKLKCFTYSYATETKAGSAHIKPIYSKQLIFPFDTNRDTEG